MAIFIKSTTNGQIGILYYVSKKFQQAKPYLEKSFFKHWVARTMFAILHYKEKKIKKMNSIFENVVKYTTDESLIWSIWAFCLSKNNDTQGAIQILKRANKKFELHDPYILQNIINLQNHKHMKMKAYGDLWYQFHLEPYPFNKSLRSKKKNIFK